MKASITDRLYRKKAKSAIVLKYTEYRILRDLFLFLLTVAMLILWIF